MSAATHATLAQAVGLALLLIHGGALAQHTHAHEPTRTQTPAVADAGSTVAPTAGAAAPVIAAAPVAAACVCPGTDAATRSQAQAAHSHHADHADHAARGHAMPDHAEMHHPATAPAAPTQSGTACSCADAAATALPREPIPSITDADRAAAFPVLRAHTMQHGPSRVGYLLLDRLEGWDADRGSGQAWEASAWYGGDIQRLWLRSEGERSGGHTEAADLEALYGRAVSPWWDVLIGVQHATAPGEARTSAAFGVQGMAPYKFEVAATLYVGEDGDASARLQGEYDVLLTNRWILQPRLEADLAFADDRARGIGSGLSTLEAGLRLRYEIGRRFAPYLGVVHERAFGATADYRRDAAEPARDTRVVAGVRVWF